jgi:hypothetical protein
MLVKIDGNIRAEGGGLARRRSGCGIGSYVVKRHGNHSTFGLKYPISCIQLSAHEDNFLARKEMSPFKSVKTHQIVSMCRYKPFSGLLFFVNQACALN